MKYMRGGFVCLMALTSWLISPVFGQGTAAGNGVNVTTERVDDSFEVVAHNQNPHSITLSLKVTGENYKVNRELPLQTAIGPKTQKRLFTVRVADRSKAFNFHKHYTWIAGNIYATHNDAVLYRLPFEKGAAYKVGQSYGGTFSHQGRSRYAVDFIMPVGTRVVAARGGVVMQLREDSDRSGDTDAYKRDSNFIVIEHDDGTLGEYAHLKKGGVLVELGERVRKGQVIGLSGNTGYSSGPHLHFMVSRVLEGGHSQSLPVRFKTGQGVVRNFKEGREYTAQ